MLNVRDVGLTSGHDTEGAEESVSKGKNFSERAYHDRGMVMGLSRIIIKKN